MERVHTSPCCPIPRRPRYIVGPWCRFHRAIQWCYTYHFPYELLLYVVRRLLEAGANPTLLMPDQRNQRWKTPETPSEFPRRTDPRHAAIIACLEEAPDAERVSILIKIRRLAVPCLNSVPSYLQDRMAKGQSLPTVALVHDGHIQDSEGGCKVRTSMAFLVGLGGVAKNEGIPEELFWAVIGFVMPWGPLRNPGAT